MEQWQIILLGMDVPMLLWLTRLGVEYRVMRRGWGAIALYAFLLIAGTLYLLWCISAWCQCGAVCP